MMVSLFDRLIHLYIYIYLYLFIDSHTRTIIYNFFYWLNSLSSMFIFIFARDLLVHVECCTNIFLN